MLKVENLSTSYKLIDGDVHVLNDLNFEIHDNEIFGIAGESGCGKTTLLKTLYDIIEFPLEIDKGKVILSGEKNGQSFSYESGNTQKTRRKTARTKRKSRPSHGLQNTSRS